MTSVCFYRWIVNGERVGYTQVFHHLRARGVAESYAIGSRFSLAEADCRDGIKRDRMRCDEIWWDMTRYDDIGTLRRDMMRHNKTWWDMIKLNVLRHDETSWDILRHDEAWCHMMRNDRMRCREKIRQSEMRWDMTRHDGKRYDEMRWDEMRWDEMRRSKI